MHSRILWAGTPRTTAPTSLRDSISCRQPWPSCTLGSTPCCGDQACAPCAVRDSHTRPANTMRHSSTPDVPPASSTRGGAGAADAPSRDLRFAVRHASATCCPRGCISRIPHWVFASGVCGRDAVQSLLAFCLAIARAHAMRCLTQPRPCTTARRRQRRRACARRRGTSA